MNTQGTLFACEPTGVNQYGYPIEHPDQAARTICRPTDPPTSKKAAQKFVGKLSAIERLFVESLSTFTYPATAQEVADRAVPVEPGTNLANAITKRDTVRKRAGELTKEKRTKSGEFVRPAVIRVVGERECYMTGNQASTYEVIR